MSEIFDTILTKLEGVDSGTWWTTAINLFEEQAVDSTLFDTVVAKIEEFTVDSTVFEAVVGKFEKTKVDSNSFGTVVGQLEKINVSISIWEIYMWVPGMWEQDNIFRKAVKQLEQVK